MKIALLAPEVMGKDILRMAKKDIKDVDISLLIYNDYKDTVGNVQEFIDALSARKKQVTL